MRIALFIITFLAIGSLQAQQMPQFSQVAMNRSLYNPAYVGYEPKTMITLGGRWQMIGFGNEPQSTFLNFERNIKIKAKPIYNPAMRVSMPIPNDNRTQKSKFSQAFGGQLSSDKYGAFKSFQLAGLYASHYQFTSLLKVSGGLKLGISNNGFDADKAQVLNVSNPELSYQGGDNEYDEFTAEKWNSNIINLGVGVNVQYGNFFIGAAANQLTKDAIQFGRSNVNFNLTSHLFLMTGYNFQITEEFKVLTTVVVKKMSPAPTSLEVSAIGNFGDVIFAGVNYHHKATAGVLVGFQVSPDFRIGYSFDASTNTIIKSSFGGHELVLNYRF
jgi:type IX secretion system PorP/SprF family membrane protein